MRPAVVISRCSRCRTELAPNSKYCGRCGAPTPSHVRERELAFEASQQHARAAVRAISVVVAGVLLSIVASAGLVRLGVPDVVATVAQYAFFVAAGVYALRVMGAHLADAITQPRGLRPWIEAVAAALVGLAVSVGYVELMRRLIELPGAEFPGEGWLGLVAAILLAPVIEEWLCRGVLWAACRRVTGTAGTLFVTAVIFAILHGLNGLSLLEMPHRFVSGLILGWLRWRTRSVVPCVAAHALHNALASILAV